MFRRWQNSDGIYFLPLIFLLFPILGSISDYYYPRWTLILTIGFALAYLLLIFIKKEFRKIIACLWFYSLAYIAFMALAYEGSMIWFLFYHVNLLVWRFGDSYPSYRWLSFMVTTIGLSLIGFFLTSRPEGKAMSLVLPVFILGMLYFQNKLRRQSELEEEIVQQHRTINLLTAENERNRIGRDLHDTLGHTFAMMTLKTELALKQLEKADYTAVNQQLEELNQISHVAMNDVRTIVNNLKYRTVSEELTEIERLFALSEIALTTKIAIKLDNLSPISQSTLTMVLRELANNIVKHSQATAVTIAIWRQEVLMLSVEDNGVGFAQLTGQELHSIRERLGLVDGQLSITSQAQPTRVLVSLREGERG